jgi:hypothetical protein
MKGGSGRASSMRRCSRHGGEGRTSVASAVWRGGDGAPFIVVGRWWWGGETVGPAAVVCYQDKDGYGRGGEGIDTE